MRENKIGISGNGLKWIAVITMLIDHVGAVVLSRMLGLSAFDWEFWSPIYWICRKIGRIAFPIFLFLLVEGFQYTKNRQRYMGRLLFFGLLSEIPFNLAIAGSMLSLQYQNVYWQLALGLGVLWLIDWIEGKEERQPVLSWALKLTILAGGMVLAEGFALDYGYYGIFSVFVIYIARKSRIQQAILGGISFLWEIPAPLAFLPILCYNGKRGKGLKFAFYLFYPVHLVVLYLLARAIGCPY